MTRRLRARLVGLGLALAGAHLSLDARADGFKGESASEEEEAHERGELTSQWSAYAHVATIGIASSTGAAVEYRPSRWFSVSAGLGAGLGVLDYLGQGGLSDYLPFGAQLFGGELMAHLLAGPAKSAHSFEYALGLSLGVLHQEGYDDTYWDSFAAYPSSTIGYRYHPLDGGFLFRAGASINYAAAGYPLPMVSAGYAF